MNYIKHLSHWFEIMRISEEVKPTHIAIYIALFRMWNQSRFAPVFIINRMELMNVSKIGNKSVYSDCMKDLHRWGWIKYAPSNSKYSNSTVTMVNFTDGKFLKTDQKTELTKWLSPSVLSPDYPVDNNANLTVNTETSNGTSSETSTETSSETSNYTSSETSMGTTLQQGMGHNNKTYKQQTPKEETNQFNNLKSKYDEQL